VGQVNFWCSILTLWSRQQRVITIRWIILFTTRDVLAITWFCPQIPIWTINRTVLLQPSKSICKKGNGMIPHISNAICQSCWWAPLSPGFNIEVRISVGAFAPLKLSCHSSYLSTCYESNRIASSHCYLN